MRFTSAALNEVLATELAAGNRVLDGGEPWGQYVLLVRLALPFRSTSFPAGLVYREVNDPHYWQAELVDERTKEMLVCADGMI
jgi:hypothetical protein